METNVHILEVEGAPVKVEGTWADAEWFRVWLQLARRDYHGHPDWHENARPDETPMAA